MLDNLWAAELITLPPISLLATLWWRKDKRLRPLPWLLTAAAILSTIWLRWYFFPNYAQLSVGDFLHTMLRLNAYDRHDYTLEPLTWEFLQFNIAPVAAFLLGFAVDRLIRNRKLKLINELPR